jgi:hypothetical protein
MTRTLFVVGLFALMAAGQPGPGAPKEGRSVRKAQLPPNRSLNLVKEFNGGERACAIIAGEGQSYLGLYVYDADGNCIARDDRANYRTRDDAAVEWYPRQTGRYSIEVKNLGGAKSGFIMAVQ